MYMDHTAATPTWKQQYDGLAAPDRAARWFDAAC